MITSETEITCCIDWLSVTATELVHHPDFTGEHVELTHGRINYNSGVEYTDGRIQLWHSERPEMKYHLIMSGETLIKMGKLYDMTSMEILAHYSIGRASRIDIAVDIKKGSLDIKGLEKTLCAGLVDTKAEGGLYMRGNGRQEGETLYVGSTKGERRLRVYDKAAESGSDGEWTRIELQMRQGQARRCVATLLVESDPNVIPFLINQYACWNNDQDWVLAMTRTKLKMLPGEIFPSNRRHWILDTCAKAIANELEYGGDSMLVGRLLDAIEVQRDVLRDKLKA